MRPQLQKLLWRTQATPPDRDFSQEDQKDRTREMGVRAAAASLDLRCAPNGAANHQTF
jgi:hypothetical protein